MTLLDVWEGPYVEGVAHQKVMLIVKVITHAALALAFVDLMTVTVQPIPGKNLEVAAVLPGQVKK